MIKCFETLLNSFDTKIIRNAIRVLYLNYLHVPTMVTMHTITNY